MNLNYDLAAYLVSIISLVMVVFLLGMSIYYLIYWSISARKSVPVPHSDKLSKFAVLIAARNESHVITHLLESLSKQTYTKEYYSVYLIVEDRNDPTMKLAQEYGFHCFIRDRLTPDRRTKGFALQECIDHIDRHNREYDAYMIFDADNLLDDNYLEVMNDLRQTGVRVGLGYRNFTNANTNWLTAGSAIMFSYMNQITSKGRSILFHKATLMGTGYFVDSSVVKEAGGWIFTGMTEDIQLTSYCVYHDIYMRYYPLVCFYDEQSPKFKTVHNQHLRWLFGYFERRTFLKKAGVQDDYHSKNMQKFMKFEFECGLIPFIIYNVVTFFLAFIALAFGILSLSYGKDYQSVILFATFGFNILMLYSVFVVPALLSVIRDHEHLKLTTKNKIIGVLTYMFYFYDFVWAFLDGLFHPAKRKTWKKIEHTGEINNEDLVNKDGK